MAVAAALNRTGDELGVDKSGPSPLVAVVSGGNVDPSLLAAALGR